MAVDCEALLSLVSTASRDELLCYLQTISFLSQFAGKDAVIELMRTDVRSVVYC